MARRIQPDRASLEHAHFVLRSTTPLDQMLADPTMRRIVENVARRHMKRLQRFDPKKAQANDRD